MKQNEFFEILPKHIKETNDLTIGSKNVLASLLFLNNNDYSKENGYFYRSNEDLINDSQVSKPTLIKSLSQLEMMGFIERKAGNRKSGASLYRINEDFTNSLKVNFTNIFTNNQRVKIEGFTQRVKSDFTNTTLPIQNPNKQREFEENFTNNFTNNFTTDTEIDKEKDKDIIYILNNNIIELNKNLKEIIDIIKNNNKNNIYESEVKKDFTNNVEEKEETVQTLKVEKKEETITIPIEDKKKEPIRKDNTAEKKIIEHFNKENTVKRSSTDYVVIPLDEQERIFKTLSERLKASTSIEELRFKYGKLLQYFKTHTFCIWYRNDASKLYNELCKNFETSTQNENKAPVSASNALDGIVISPTDLKPLESNKSVKETIATNEPISEPTSVSNCVDGATVQEDEDKPTESKIIAIKSPQQIRDERIQELKQMIFFAESIEDLKQAGQKIKSLRNSISTEEMNELNQIMGNKRKEVA